MANKYMSYEEKLATFEKAIALTKARIELGKEVEIYRYILNQLEFLVRYLSDKSEPKEKLFEVNIGHLAVREFEDVDPAYSSVLKKAFFIVHFMKKGLKVPVTDENGNIV